MILSGHAKRETAKGRNRTRNAHFRRFLQIFTDFRLALQIKGFGSRRVAQKTADFRRKPQKTADFRSNRFLPFAVSLLARSHLAWRFSPETPSSSQAPKNLPAPATSVWHLSCGWEDATHDIIELSTIS